MILIVSNAYDLHVDVIEPILRDKAGERGLNLKSTYFRLDLDRFPRDYDFHFTVTTQGQRLNGFITDLTTQTRIQLDQVTAVWLRKPGEYAWRDPDISPQEAAFGHDECEHILMSMLYSLDCYWMSHPMYIRGAQWKGEQLQRAARMQFDIPSSVISNCGDPVKTFRKNSADGIIFKALSSPSLAAEQVAPEERSTQGLNTTLIDDEMANDLDAISYMPGHFQHCIEKQYELRVTVIGEKVFAARINSQQDDRTKIDFRDYSADIKYESASLSDELTQRCKDFVHSYGLNYGAIDLIVTPDEKVLFLENNPVGQFWFVQQLVPELKMMEAVADCLLDAEQQRASI